MTANAIVTWNEKGKRYELHIDNVLKAYSTSLEGTGDTQESHKGGLEDLCTIAKKNGYTVIVEPYKADTEKREGE